MDRVETNMESMTSRLETTLEIIMEHFKETYERLEEIETRIEELEEWTHPPVAPGGTTELKAEIQELRDAIRQTSD